MLKTLTTIFCLLIISLGSFATIVPAGTITTNTTWTKAGSPYIITGDVTFDTNTTLTVQPGVEIRFDSSHCIIMKGKLLMLGSVIDTILITTNNLIRYYQGFDIRYSNHTDTNYINYCKFSYGTYAINSGTTPLKLMHSTFIDCAIAVSLTGIVDSCSFKDCGTGVGTNTSFTITNSSFINCNYGISSSSATNTYCANNYFQSCGTGIIKCNYVINNTFVGCEVRAIEACFNVHYNKILFNKIGIEILGDSTTYNCIEFNDVGINNTYFTTTSMKLHNNCIANNYTYNIMTNASPNIDASNNFWGATDSTTISSKVMDYYDQSYRSKTLFMPFLYSPDSACDTSILNITTTEQKSKTITVYPNPVSSFVTLDAGTQFMQEVFIYNMTGSLVFHSTTYINKLEINASSFPNGMYMYKVRLGDESIVTGKILKE